MSNQYSTLAALKSVAPIDPLRTDGNVTVVHVPEAGSSPSWYSYDSDSTQNEIGSIIVAPNAGDGRYIRHSGLVHYATAKPTAAPVIRGVIWIATLSNPSRVIRYLSIGTSTAADWHPIGNPVLHGTVNPAFTPDFVGQQFYNTSSNNLRVAKATGLVSDWVSVTIGSADLPPISYSGSLPLIAHYPLNAIPYNDSTSNGLNLTPQVAATFNASTYSGDGITTVTGAAGHTKFEEDTAGNYGMLATGASNLFGNINTSWRLEFEVRFAALPQESSIEWDIIGVTKATFQSGQSDPIWRAGVRSTAVDPVNNPPDYKIFFDCASGNPSTTDPVQLESGILAINTWYQVFVEYNASTDSWVMNVNGTQTATATTIANAVYLNRSDTRLKIGTGWSVGYPGASRPVDMRRIKYYRAAS